MSYMCNARNYMEEGVELLKKMYVLIMYIYIQIVKLSPDTGAWLIFVNGHI
jgi:hypothetical protein